MSRTKRGREAILKTRRRRGSYLGVTGKYPSLKSSHCLFAESLRERDLFAMANFDPSLEVVEDHPLTIQYQHEGRQRKYTPDARLVRRGMGHRAELIEVKTSDHLEKNQLEYAPAFAAAREYAAARGEVFRILTEAELPRPLVRNLRFLFPYRKRPAKKSLEEAILATLAMPVSLNALCSELEQAGHARGAVIAQAWRLVALQRVATDLDKPLTLEAVLELRAWEVTV